MKQEHELYEESGFLHRLMVGLFNVGCIGITIIALWVIGVFFLSFGA